MVCLLPGFKSLSKPQNECEQKARTNQKCGRKCLFCLDCQVTCHKRRPKLAKPLWSILALFLSLNLRLSKFIPLPFLSPSHTHSVLPSSFLSFFLKLFFIWLGSKVSVLDLI